MSTLGNWISSESSNWTVTRGNGVGPILGLPAFAYLQDVDGQSLLTGGVQSGPIGIMATTPVSWPPSLDSIGVSVDVLPTTSLMFSVDVSKSLAEKDLIVEFSIFQQEPDLQGGEPLQNVEISREFRPIDTLSDALSNFLFPVLGPLMDYPKSQDDFDPRNFRDDDGPPTGKNVLP